MKTTIVSGLKLNLLISMGILAMPSIAAQPEVLIKWRNPPRQSLQILASPEARPALQRLGAELRKPIGTSGWEVAALPEGADVRAWLQQARRDPAVAHAEPNRRYHALATVNDRLFSRLHGLTQIGAPVAWDTTNGSSSVVVAVFDTGLNLTHPDLSPVLWINTAEIPGNASDDDANGVVDDVHGADFVDHDGDPTDDAGHGSHVAGIIAGAGNNQIGVAGVAYGCRVMPVRILSADGSALTSDIVRAFEYVRALKLRGVNVRLINNSWGGPFPSLAIFEAVSACADAGILNICGAGNDFQDTDIHPFYPAAYDSPGVMSIAASDECDLAAFFSNFGARTVHLAAPGSRIYSAWGRGHAYGIASGTSMAAPHVTGAAALLLSRQPALTLAQLRAVLLRQADAISIWTNRTATGARLNVAKAMTFLNSGQPVPTNDPPNLALTNTTRRIVSRARTGGPARDVSFSGSLGSSVSENGRYVVFLSYDTNLVTGDTWDFLDVFIRDTVANTNGRVSQTIGGIGADADCETPVISRDGNYVAFVSTAGNLVTGDTDGARDVFVWERATRNLRLVSFDPENQPFTLDAGFPAISDDGGFVAFAADFPDGFGGSIRDIYVWRRTLNNTQIINFKTPSTFANDWSDSPSISAEGRYVAYHTWADNLVTPDTNNAADILVYDRIANTTTRASRTPANQQANADSLFPILSGDGRYVTYLSSASNLGLLPTNGVAQNYLYDRTTSQLLQISLDARGQPLAATNTTFDVNHDGRFVVLSTDSDQLPPLHGLRTERTFLWDRLTRFLNVVGLNDGGFPADDSAFYPSISATGEWIAFASWANNLVAPDGNNLLDVFLWRRGTQLADLRIRTTGQTNWTGAGIVHPLTPQRVTASAQTNGISRAEAQVFNAGLAATPFQLRATVTPGWQLIAQNTNNADITAALLAGTHSAGTLAAGASYFVRLSLNRTNAFADPHGAVHLTARVSSTTKNLDAVQAFATRTLTLPGLRLASRNAVGEPGLLGALTPSLNGNGQLLAFATSSDNLTATDENFAKDIFVADFATGGLTLASSAADGTPGNAHSLSPFLAQTGEVLAFESDANNLVPMDANDAPDIYVKNLQNGTIEMASLGASGNTLSRGSMNPMLNQDGRFVLFESIASNVVPGDTNACTDVFLRDRQSGTVECVNLGASGQWGNADSIAVAMTPDARFVLFLTHASNLGMTDTNEFPDLYLRDRVLNTLELISGRTEFETSDGHALGGSLSDDGRFVVFGVEATHLLPGATNHAFLLDRITGLRTPILPGVFSLPADKRIYSAEISPNGELLALVAGGGCGSTNATVQICLTTREGGAARVMSATRSGVRGSLTSFDHVFSGSSRQLAFASAATNLVGEPWPESHQIFMDDTTVLYPDAALASAQGSWRGSGEVGTNQSTIEQPIAFNNARDFFLRVTDFSGAGGPVVVTAPTGNGTHWSVRYFSENDAGLEVTASMPGGWTFNPGTNALDLRLRIRVTILATNAPASFAITVRSADFPTLQESILFSLVQDADNDGLSDLWERTTFNNSLTTANAATDFDGDDQNDLQEYVAGTDPKNSASHLRLDWLALSGAVATFELPTTHTNRFYRLEATEALNEAFTIRTLEQRGNGGALLLQDFLSGTGTNGFYRARAALP